VVRYLKGTKDRGILKPNRTSFDVYIDATFSGNWNQSEAESWDTTHEKKQVMGQVRIITSLNLAPEIKLERLDLNTSEIMTYSDLPVLTYHDLLCLSMIITYRPTYYLQAYLLQVSHKIIQAFPAIKSNHHDFSVN